MYHLWLFVISPHNAGGGQIGNPWCIVCSYSINFFKSDLLHLYIDLIDRFTPEEKAKRPPLCYLPFGFGRRSCIGLRLAKLEAKIALIQLLRKYTFVRAPDTQVSEQLRA